MCGAKNTKFKTNFMANISPSVQDKIDIAEIKDGIVVLKDGSLRAILAVSSINFALKSTEEQDAITYQYQGILNSLDFPIQILIASRKFDISNYLSTLNQKQKEQENELLRIQISEYTDFIKGLTELANIITEIFYVVIPLAAIESKKMSFAEKIGTLVGLSKKNIEEEKRTFEEMKTQLWQRINYTISGLESLGLRVAPLNTEELIELFYKMYNPEAKEKNIGIAAKSPPSNF
jgi:hypothetical protein